MRAFFSLILLTVMQSAEQVQQEVGHPAVNQEGHHLSV